jgi:16S rRNA (guanine1207-N2)-methyltransferase
VDSSVRAVRASRANALRNDVASNTLVLLAHDLQSVREASLDVCLANPPYYGDFRIAEMFASESLHSLVKGGKLFLVTKAPGRPKEIVTELFGSVEVVTRRGYAVLCATKR